MRATEVPGWTDSLGWARLHSTWFNNDTFTGEGEFFLELSLNCHSIKLHLFILDGVKMDVTNPINCLLLKTKELSHRVNGYFCLIFAKIGLSKLGSSQTDLFKGNKAETPVTSGLLVH